MDRVWNEVTIARCLNNGVFKSQYIAVPRCWVTGSECDLLVVSKSLKFIDVEVKTSRADFRLDAKKDKWWTRKLWQGGREHFDWPAKVWKHYYAMPAKLWTDDLLERAGSTKSGIILLGSKGGGVSVSEIRKQAQPNSKAPTITTEDMFALARAAGFRMWSTMNELAVHQQSKHRRTWRD